MSQRGLRRAASDSRRRVVTATVRVSDDFDARSLDTSKWAIVPPKSGTGGGVTFTTASMVDLTTSNLGSYHPDAALFLYENKTPSSVTDNSDITVQFTVPSDRTATLRVSTRMPVVGPGRKNYEMFLDAGNGAVVLARRGDSYDEASLYQGVSGAFATEAGTVWKMRFRTATASGGVRLTGKLWAVADSEPSSWLFDLVDNTSGYSTGYNVISAYPGSAAVGYTWKIDSITIYNV